jgi:hypothetical protein
MFPRVVGYYAGAEKISNAFLGLLNPLTQTRLSRLAYNARHRAARVARLRIILSWRAYYTTRNLLLLLKLYGENGTVISTPLFYELCKHVQFLSRRVQCR